MVARQTFEPKYKNLLLMDTNLFNKKYGKNLELPQQLPKKTKAVCFPKLRMPSEANDPNAHWRCYQNNQRLELTHELAPNMNSEMVIDIENMPYAEYKRAENQSMK